MIRIQTLQGVILERFQKGTPIDVVIKAGEKLALERGQNLRAYSGMCKVASFKAVQS